MRSLPKTFDVGRTLATPDDEIPTLRAGRLHQQISDELVTQLVSDVSAVGEMLQTETPGHGREEIALQTATKANEEKSMEAMNGAGR